MAQSVKCPVCLSPYDAKCTASPHAGDQAWFHCEICGDYILTGAMAAILANRTAQEFPPIKRAALSHVLRRSWDQHQAPFMIQSYWFEDNVADFQLPTPAEQALNIIRLIGDGVRSSGTPLTRVGVAFYARVGAPSLESAMSLLQQLVAKGRVTASIAKQHPVAGVRVGDMDLTLDGWEVYEKEQRGAFAGRYGFIAMQFGDARVDEFINAMKPRIEELTRYRLERLDDRPEAGLIDNLLRLRIREAAFVIADLSHGNKGAYWEAGYAEGLGKPVIYICEKSAWDDPARRPHFDVNHQQTVMWTQTEPEDFVQRLQATIRYTLKL